MLPMELDVDESDSSLSMPEHRASLSLPLEILPCSPRGVNLSCWSVVLVLAAIDPSRAL
jgi:hypothetical protein